MHCWNSDISDISDYLESIGFEMKVVGTDTLETKIADSETIQEKDLKAIASKVRQIAVDQNLAIEAIIYEGRKESV